MRNPKARQVASAVALTAALLAVPATAHADTGGCASRGEYDQLTRGMSSTSVRNLFDIDGRFDGETEFSYIVSFRTCWAPGEKKIRTFFAYSDGLLRRWDVVDV